MLNMLINVYKIYTGPLSVQAQYSRLCPISSSFRYNGWLDCPNCLLYNFSVRTTSKTPFFFCCVCVLFRGNLFTEPLLRNGRFFIRLLHSNDCTCLLRGLCLAAALYATICKSMESPDVLCQKYVRISTKIVRNSQELVLEYCQGREW
jgi:hypothetical protein